MSQQFNPASKTHSNLDDQGVVRELLHEEPVVSQASTAQQAAHEYLQEHGELLGLAPAELSSLAISREAQPVSAGREYRLQSEKHQFDTTTVTYDQTHFGLRVWGAGVSVHLK